MKHSQTASTLILAPEVHLQAVRGDSGELLDCDFHFELVPDHSPGKPKF